METQTKQARLGLSSSYIVFICPGKGMFYVGADYWSPLEAAIGEARKMKSGDYHTKILERQTA